MWDCVFLKFCEQNKATSCSAQSQPTYPVYRSIIIRCQINVRSIYLTGEQFYTIHYCVPQFTSYRLVYFYVCCIPLVETLSFVMVYSHEMKTPVLIDQIEHDFILYRILLGYAYVSYVSIIGKNL